MKYYYILIDCLNKTLQVREYEENSCDAREMGKVCMEFNVNNPSWQTRFKIFFNDTRDYIDYSLFYKKYAKYTVIQ